METPESPRDFDSRILFSLEEARHQLGGISRSKIYSLASSGALTITKIGRRSFISAKSLRIFANGLGVK